MNFLETIEDIEKKCYSDKYRDALDELNTFIEEIANRKTDSSALIHILKTMMMAMEKRDNILIADCLEYGVKPLINRQDVFESFFCQDVSQLPDIGEKVFYYASFLDEPVLCIRGDDGTIIRLNSLFSPINEVKSWVSNLNIDSKTTVVCLFGIGTGLFAEAVLEKLPEKSRMIVYEPDKDILDYCLKEVNDIECDEAEIKISNRIKSILEDKRVTLVIEKENRIDFRYKLDECLDYLEFPGLIIAKHNNYDRVYPESCLSFLREISDYHRKVITNRNTMELFKESILINTAKNLFYFKNINMCDEIGEILPKDIPVVIVSAGPSLDKNIDLLHQVKGHFLIFAVDTAVRHLLKKNIVPDLTITIDSKKPANYFPDEESHKIPCIFDVTANPEILSKHKGRVLLFNNSNFYVGKIFEELGRNLPMIANGGSVATAAFAFCYLLKQKKIILIGQDLASVNGFTHAGGVNDNSGYTETLVDGYYGGKVTTRSDWLGYLKWFEKSIEAIREKGEDIRVIDATEGGAKIHGAEQMTLQEVIDECRDTDGRLPEYEFENELNNLAYSFSEVDNRELIGKHKEAIEKLKEISREADDAIRICKKLLSGIENGTVSASYIDKEKKKITKITNRCSRLRVFSLLNDYMITDVIDEIAYLQFADGDTRTTEMNGIKLMMISFEAILDAANAIYKKVKEIGE